MEKLKKFSSGTAIVVLGVVAWLGGCGRSTPAPQPTAALLSGRIVDLTHSYDESTIFWPTAERFRLDRVSAGETSAGYYYAANNFFTAEHGGTHLDAPVHFARGAQTVDEIPVDRFVGAGFVVDVTEAAAADPDHQVSVGDLQAAEGAQGAIPNGAIVLLRTGYSQRWPDADGYLGTAQRGEAAVAGLHFPGLHPEAARWLLDNRQVKAIGIDTASIDYGQSTSYESHRALFERNVPVFENLTGLEQLPPLGAIVIALPMKIGGGSGAPLRAIAIVP